MIDLSKLGGSGGQGPAVGGTPAPMPEDNRFAAPTFVNTQTAPSSPDGENHNWIWDQVGRALFGSQEEFKADQPTGGGLLGDQPVKAGQHGGLLGDIPGISAVARMPGAAWRGVSDAGGVGVGAISSVLAEGMSLIPSASYITDPGQAATYGLGDPNKASMVNAWDPKYGADPRDPISVGQAGFALAQDINSTFGNKDMSAQFLVLGQWMQQYDPEAFADWQKTLAEAQADTVGGHASEKISRFIRGWSVNYADMTPTGYEGFLAENPELAFAGEGSFGQGFADDLSRIMIFQRKAEKGAAGMTGSQGGGIGPIPVGVHLVYEKDGVVQQDMGSRLNELLYLSDNDPKKLTPVEAQVVVGMKELGWTAQHAMNYLLARGQGYSSNPGVQTVLGMALDPTFVAGLGVGAAGVSAAKAGTYGTAAEALQGLRTSVSAGRLTSVANDVARLTGITVREVRAHPILGPAARVTRAIVDPLGALPGPRGAAKADVMQAVGLKGFENGMGPAALADATRNAERLGIRDIANRATGTSAINYARKWSVARHIDNLAGFSATGARRQITEDLVQALGENAPKDAVARLADYVYRHREFWLSESNIDQLVNRVATMAGKSRDEVADMVKGMSRDEQAVWHQWTWTETFRDFTDAVAKVPPEEWGSMLNRLEDFTPLNPSELDVVAAQGLHSTVAGLAGKKTGAKAAIQAWNEAADRYSLIGNIGKVTTGGVHQLQRKLNLLDRIIQEGGLHQALDAAEMKALPKSFTRDFIGKHGSNWRLGFKPKALQATGLVYDEAGELIGRYEPSIGNVTDMIPNAPRRPQPLTDLLGRTLGDTKVGRAADSLEVAFKTARDRVSSERIMVSMEQSFVKQMRTAGYGEKIAKDTFKVARTFAQDNGFTIAGMNAEEFWNATKPVLGDLVDARVAKRDIFTMLAHAAGGDLRLLGLTSGGTQRIRAALIARGLDPNNYLGAVTVRLYNTLRYALNPTFFLQAEFDAPWFNMYRGVMFDLRGRMPKPGSALYELQGITEALGKSSISRDLQMDFTERVATIGFQREVVAGLRSIPNLELSLGQRIKNRLGRMIMNNELAYINSQIGDVVVDAIETTRANLLKEAANAADPELAAQYTALAERMDIEHVFDHLRETMRQDLGRLPTKNELGLRYLSEMIHDSQLEVRTAEGLLDFKDTMRKGNFYKTTDIGKIEPLDLDYGAASLSLPNVHNAGDLRSALMRGATTTGDIRDIMKAEGFHKANIDRFLNELTFNWESHFRDLRETLGMSRFEMQAIEDLIVGEAKALGVSPVAYMTQVLPLTGKIGKYASEGRIVAQAELDAIKARGAALMSDATTSWTPRTAPVKAPAGMAAHTLANGGGTFDVATGRELGQVQGYGVAHGPQGLVVDPTPEAINAAWEQVSLKGSDQIGTWLNPADGKVYVDPTQVVADQGEAMRLAQARGEKAIYDFAGGQDIPVEQIDLKANIDKVADDLYQRTALTEWGGATYSPVTGQFIEQADPWMHHGTSGRFSESISKSGITRGDWAADPTSPMIPGESMYGRNAVMYRSRRSAMLGGEQKAEGWTSGNRVAAKDLQISRDGGKTWEDVVQGSGVGEGPWVSGVGKTTSITIKAAQDPKKFRAALDRFVKANEAELRKPGMYVGTFRDDAIGKVEFDVARATSTAADTEAVQAFLGREGGAYNTATGNGLFAPRLDPMGGAGDHVRLALDAIRAAAKGKDGLDEMTKLAASTFHPSMKARLLESFIERITGKNGLIEQALAAGDAKTAQDLNLVLEDLRGGWGQAADNEFRDLVVRRVGGDPANAGASMVAPAKFTKDARGNAVLPSAFTHEDGYVYRVEHQGTLGSALPEGSGVTTGKPTAFYVQDTETARIIRVKDNGDLLPGRHGAGGADRRLPRDIPVSEQQVLAADGTWHKVGAVLPEPEVERAVRYFRKYMEDISPSITVGERLRMMVEDLPVEGASPYDYSQSLLMDTLAENFRLAERDAIRLAHIQPDRSVLERSLNHPFFAMYPSSYFWGKVIPETFRFMAYEPFGIRTGAGVKAYYNVKQSIALQSQYDPKMKALWDKVGKSAVMGLMSYLSPSMPWEDMASNLPPWVRALGRGEDFGQMVTRQFDMMSPDRWVNRFLEAGKEVSDGVSTVIDSLTPEQQQGLQNLPGAGSAPATVEPQGFKGPVKGTELGPILQGDLADLQAALGK